MTGQGSKKCPYEKSKRALGKQYKGVKGNEDLYIERRDPQQTNRPTVSLSRLEHRRTLRSASRFGIGADRAGTDLALGDDALGILNKEAVGDKVSEATGGVSGVIDHGKKGRLFDTFIVVENVAASARGNDALASDAVDVGNVWEHGAVLAGEGTRQGESAASARVDRVFGVDALEPKLVARQCTGRAPVLTQKVVGDGAAATDAHASGTFGCCGQTGSIALLGESGIVADEIARDAGTSRS